MAENNWDEQLNLLSVTDFERVSSFTEVTNQYRAYASNELKGVYHCVRCNFPVYSSKDKFTPLESNLGDWPNFRAPIDLNSIQISRSFSFGIETNNILCAKCGLYLGNLYLDGKEVDGHPDAKERHTLISFSIQFVKDPSENGDFVVQTPRELLPTILEKKIVDLSSEPISPPVVVKKINNIIENNKADNNNNNTPPADKVAPVVVVPKKDEKLPEEKNAAPVEPGKKRDSEVERLLPNLPDKKTTERKTPADKIEAKANNNKNNKNNNNNNNNDNNAAGGSHFVRNVTIIGVVVGVVAVAGYYYWTKNEHK